MAPCKLVALFAFTVVAATTTVRPSEATIGGDQLALHPSTFHNTTPPPPPSSSGGGAVPPHLSTASAPSPPPPPPPAQPTECMTPLIGMMPCADFLTNLTARAPTAGCCNGLKSVIRNAPICLCHGITGGMDDLMPLPIDLGRMIILPLACGTKQRLQTLFSCNTQVPPIMPPMALPAPANPPASP